MNLSRFFRLPADLSPRVRANTYHYYGDISWWGLYAGATAAFLTIYAARIGATPQQIGLLNALPALIALLLALPFAGLVRRLGAHTATWTSALVGRSLLLGYAILPFFLPEHAQILAILGLASLMALPNTLIGISFPQLMIEALPSTWRGAVVGARNVFFAIISFVFTLLSGQILTHMAAPGGYQVVFVIGFVGAAMTAYHLWRVRPLAPEDCLPEDLALPDHADEGARHRFLPHVDAQGRRYLRVLGLLFLFNATNNMVVPLVPGVLVNALRLSDAWISIGTAATALIVFGVSIFITRLTFRTGNRAATALGAVCLAGQALLLAVARDPAHYLLSVLASGLGSGILNTAQFNYHLENVPQAERPTWLSWNYLLGNAALLLGSLTGPLVAAQTGTPVALVAFGLLRLVMAVMILRAR